MASKRMTTLSWGCALAAMMWGEAVLAQQAADAPSGDIVVTAQRRSQTMQSVPASIAAFSGDDLEKAGIVSASDISKVVPNLNTQSPLGEGSGPVFVLRGITSNDYSPNQSHPVALYVDDGIRGSSALEAVQLYDLERVEVLRGPQGTLYGKNATGGAINLITRKPSFKDDGYLTAGYGTFDRVELKGAAETTLVDDVLAVRLAFQMIKDKGLIDNVLPDAPRKDQTDTLGVRASFVFRPTDDFEATLRVFHARAGGQGMALYGKNIAPYLGVSREGLGFYEVRSNYNPTRKLRDSGFNLNLDWQLNDALTLTSVTTYDWASQRVASDSDGLEVAADHIVIATDDMKQFMQELRLGFDDGGPLKLMGGLFYNYDSMRVSNKFNFLNEPSLGIIFDPNDYGVPYSGPTLYGLNMRNSFDQRRKSYAAYFRADYDLTDKLSVFGGLRYSYDKISALNYEAAIGGSIDTTGLALVTEAPWRYPVPTLSDIDRKKSFDNVSVEVGADYKLGDALVYATFKQGYRTGAANASAFQSVAETDIVRPETVDSYEVGVKYQTPSRLLTVNIAGFRYDYKDHQFQATDGALIILRNAPKARVWGAEVESWLRPMDGLTLSAGIGWLDPKFLVGDTTPNDPTTGDVSGNQLIGANKFMLNLGIDWRVARLDAGDLNLRLNGAYRSRTYYQPDNSKDLSQPGYWLANGRLSFDMDRFSLALWGRNLLGKKYFVASFAYADAVGVDQFYYGPRRQFGIEGTVHF